MSVSHYDPGPDPPYQPDEPVTAEQKLDAFSQELEGARKLLIEARNAEMTAKEIRDEAWREAMLSPECPKVGVFGGVRTTVAMQTAWVARQIADQEGRLHRATLNRQEASDKFRTLRAQASYQQTLARGPSW